MVSAQAYAAVMKYTLTVNGLFIWEFFTTLDYEWEVFRGRLPYRWTIWIYSFSRVTGFVSLIVTISLLSAPGRINHCQLWVTVPAVFLSLATSSATILLVLRIIAIWNRNKVIVALVILLGGTYIVGRFEGIVMLRVIRDPVHLACEPVNIQASILGFIPALIANMVLLLIMFVGLLVLRRHDGASGTSGLTYFLWKQGVVWFGLAVATEVPPLVLFALNFSYQLNLVFVAPCAVTLIIAATRMHRSLVNFASATPDRAQLNPVSSIDFSGTVRTDTAPTTLHLNELAVHTTFEQHQIAHISKDGSSSDTTISSAHPSPIVSPSPIQFAQSV